jgi:hypothetical protein
MAVRGASVLLFSGMDVWRLEEWMIEDENEGGFHTSGRSPVHPESGSGIRF